MKKTILALCAVSALACSLHAQQPASVPLPLVPTTEQAQAATTRQMQQSILLTIANNERSFAATTNIVTANQAKLSAADVVAGFGDAFNLQVQQEGALLLSTIIKSNLILARNDPWLAQAWVQQWIAAYKLDPATGEPAAAPAPLATPTPAPAPPAS